MNSLKSGDGFTKIIFSSYAKKVWYPIIKKIWGVVNLVSKYLLIF